VLDDDERSAANKNRVLRENTGGRTHTSASRYNRIRFPHVGPPRASLYRDATIPVGDDMLTPTGYPPPPNDTNRHGPQRTQHTASTAATPRYHPGWKTNLRRRADVTQPVYAHPFWRAQTQGGATAIGSIPVGGTNGSTATGPIPVGETATGSIPVEGTLANTILPDFKLPLWARILTSFRTRVARRHPAC